MSRTKEIYITPEQASYLKSQLNGYGYPSYMTHVVEQLEEIGPSQTVVEATFSGTVRLLWDRDAMEVIDVQHVSIEALEAPDRIEDAETGEEASDSTPPGTCNAWHNGQVETAIRENL